MLTTADHFEYKRKRRGVKEFLGDFQKKRSPPIFWIKGLLLREKLYGFATLEESSS